MSSFTETALGKRVKAGLDKAMSPGVRKNLVWSLPLLGLVGFLIYKLRYMKVFGKRLKAALAKGGDSWPEAEMKKEIEGEIKFCDEAGRKELVDLKKKLKQEFKNPEDKKAVEEKAAKITKRLKACEMKLAGYHLRLMKALKDDESIKPDLKKSILATDSWWSRAKLAIPALSAFDFFT